MNVSVATCDGVRTLTIDRESRRTALDRATLAELEAAFQEAEHDATVRVIVLRRAGERICTMAEMESGAAMRYLRESIILTSRSEDAQEGIRAFFEKREPRWAGC